MGVAHDAEVWPIQITCEPQNQLTGDPWVAAVKRVRESTSVEDRRSSWSRPKETEG